VTAAHSSIGPKQAGHLSWRPVRFLTFSTFSYPPPFSPPCSRETSDPAFAGTTLEPKRGAINLRLFLPVEGLRSTLYRVVTLTCNFAPLIVYFALFAVSPGGTWRQLGDPFASRGPQVISAGLGLRRMKREGRRSKRLPFRTGKALNANACPETLGLSRNRKPVNENPDTVIPWNGTRKSMAAKRPRIRPGGGRRARIE